MRTIMIIKPDATDLIAELLTSLTKHQIKICSIKTKMIDPKVAEILYNDHKEKYFFAGLMSYMSSAPCILVQIEGEPGDVAKAKQDIRTLIKEHHNIPNNDDSVFREEYQTTFDGIHIPDQENATRELSLFFKKDKPMIRVLNEEEKANIVKIKLENK